MKSKSPWENIPRASEQSAFEESLGLTYTVQELQGPPNSGSLGKGILCSLPILSLASGSLLTC